MGVKYICSVCGNEYPVGFTSYRCDCGGVFDLNWTSHFDRNKIKTRQKNMWRYQEAIPILDDSPVHFDEGFTPLLSFHQSRKQIWIKQDYLFPSGSYKDRGAAVLINMVRALGIDHVVEDSSGNAGSAVAAYCARMGIDCDIYVPADNSSGKLVQIESYGARLVKVPGSRQETAEAAEQAAGSSFYASHSWNPFFFHGTKTFAFEVWEQLGWTAPDVLVLPAGNGTLFLGAFIGFMELKKAGQIEKIPRFIAVQSANCAPLYQAFKSNSEKVPDIAADDTIAEGIAISKPVRGSQILQAVKQTDGLLIPVTEDEIKASLKNWCRKGFFIEPTSAAVLAGLEKYVNQNPQPEVIVSVFTGNGLKAPEKIEKILMS